MSHTATCDTEGKRLPLDPSLKVVRHDEMLTTRAHLAFRTVEISHVSDMSIALHNDWKRGLLSDGHHLVIGQHLHCVHLLRAVAAQIACAADAEQRCGLLLCIDRDSGHSVNRRVVRKCEGANPPQFLQGDVLLPAAFITGSDKSSSSAKLIFGCCLALDPCIGVFSVQTGQL